MRPDPTHADSVLKPVVYDYRSVSAFLSDLLSYQKSQPPFKSLRQRLKELKNPCSPALVSQVLAGKRTIKRDKLPILAKIFGISEKEFVHLDTLLREDLLESPVLNSNSAVPSKRVAKNSILKYWLNPYIKDLASIRGFKPDALTIFSMLKGLATPTQIEKSLQFLFHEGFLRKTTDGKTVVNEEITFSSNNTPNEKIRSFHKKALQITSQGLNTHSINERKASTVLVSVDEGDFEALKELLESFQNQLADFIKEHPNGKDRLVQVSLHLTPIGALNEKSAPHSHRSTQ